MTNDDRIKVTKAGFQIIRIDDSQPGHPKIKFFRLNGGNGAWCTLRKFETKAARDREFKKMCSMNLIISD